MESLDAEVQALLAELNRRVLAGRPIAAAELAALEREYAEVNDRWGPPAVPFAASSGREQARCLQEA